MTVDETLCRATDSLILSSKRAFFPIKIPNQHAQLRHYISTSDPDIVYFATGADICSLRLSTRRGNLIASVPFEPRSLAAGFGWIALGGPQNGSCAFIRIGEQDGGNEEGINISTSAEVDALLPLDLEDLDPTPRRHFDRPLAQPPPVSSPSRRRKPEVFVHELGGDIVNSVTLFRMPGDGKNLSSEDLCLLSNNDMTVKIFSLTQGRVLDTLEHTACMNYALISPSGKLLAAVGDENRVYFYERNISNITTHGIKSLAKYHWKRISSPSLPKDPHLEEDHYFTIAFSPSGHLCAVASQGGVITIFNARALHLCPDGEDAIVCSFRSSRRSISGAVRSMSFSPEPWDLLVWAEDHGRICVADVRERFRRRQTIELNVHATDLERRDISDLLDPDLEFNPETRAIRAAIDGDDDGPSPAMADYMEAATERQRLRRQARALAQGVIREASPHVLTERERQILSALRTSRQRLNEIETSMGAGFPYSVDYRSPIGHPSRAPPNHNPDEPRTGHFQSLNTLREFIQERNRAAERVAEHGAGRNVHPHVHPRRRGSIVLSQGNNSESNTSHPATSTVPPARPGATGASTLTVSPARLLSPEEPNSASTGSSTSTSDPWQTIEAALQASPGPSQPEAASRLRREREAAIEANFEGREAQAVRLEAERFMRTRMPRDRGGLAEDYGYRLYQDVDDVGTAGLGWSEDGRLLYVGTEEGILEYHVNIQDRKTFPDFSVK